LNNWCGGLHRSSRAGIIERQDFKIIFQYHPLFPPGKDKSPYRKLTSDFVRIETFGPHEFIRVERESLRLLAEQAMRDINHLLKPTALSFDLCPFSGSN